MLEELQAFATKIPDMCCQGLACRCDQPVNQPLPVELLEISDKQQMLHAIFGSWRLGLQLIIVWSGRMTIGQWGVCCVCKAEPEHVTLVTVSIALCQMPCQA